MGVSSLVLACAGAPARSQAPASAATGPASPEPAVEAATRNTPVAGHRQLSLVYRAPAACPGPDSYVRQVVSRATALSIELQPAAPTAADTTRVSVGLSEGPQGWVGNLDIADAEGLSRTVQGDRCEDVIEALALITVLRLEPSAIAAGEARGAAASGASPSAGRAEIASSGEVSTKLEPAAAPAIEPSPVEPTAEEPSADATRAGAQTPDVEPPEAEAPRRDEAASASPDLDPVDAIASRANIAAVPPPAPLEAPGDAVEPPALTEPESVLDTSDQERIGASSDAPLRFGLIGYVAYASVPSNALELSLQGEIPLGVTPGWSASLIVAYTRGSDENTAGTGTFNLWTAEAQLCGPAVSHPTWWLQPCAAVRAGFLMLDFSPNGEQTFSAPGATRPWAALGPGFQAGVPLSSDWTLRGTGGLSFILVRDYFEVRRTAASDPSAPAAEPANTPFYRPGALSFELGIGLGHTF